MKKKKQKKTEEEKEAGIPCEWVGITKSAFMQESKETKSGRYSQTNFNIPGYGFTSWVVVGYLKVDYNKYLLQNYTEEDVVTKCAEYLSKPPPRKKYQKRESKPLYGTLTPLPAPWRGPGKFSLKKRPGFDDQLIVEMVTDQRKNNNFWGEGPSLLGKTRKKPGRKKKEKKDE